MEELEAHTVMVVWDWNVDDINKDEDDRRAWVPVTPHTLAIGEAECGGRSVAAMLPMTLVRLTTNYTMQLSQSKVARQVMESPITPRMLVTEEMYKGHRAEDG